SCLKKGINNQMVRKRNRGYSQKVGLDDLLRQPLCGKGESPYFVYLQYLVNDNVLQTFVEGLHALRQILATFALPISH
ncbi:hypothetical protein, partial [Geobacillus sp. 47C-IIb]|uniref:hypothetical protein n=1 Tax=Geobacillus sp. 47C-IIb TaxID=1963026 RepID=UPI001E373C37